MVVVREISMFLVLLMLQISVIGDASAVECNKSTEIFSRQRD